MKKGDVNGDGHADLLVGEAYFSDTSSDVRDFGRAHLVYGPISGSRELWTSDGIFLGEYFSGFAGTSVSTAGDVNGDGLDDVLVGSPNPAGDPGRAYVLFAPVTGSFSLSEADWILNGAAGGRAGEAVGAAGDVDADGYSDMLVGEPMVDEGRAYLVHGYSTGATELSTAGAVFVGEDGGDHAGEGVNGAGDLDGNGHDDLLIGAYFNGEERGSAYVVLGPVTGSLELATADAVIAGETREDWLGWQVSPAGDFDGDGGLEVVVSAVQDDSCYPGKAYLFGGDISGSLSASDTDLLFVGEGATDHAGRGLSGGGDLNGDGLGDIVVGAPYNDDEGQAAGKVYVVFGSRD